MTQPHNSLAPSLDEMYLKLTEWTHWESYGIDPEAAADISRDLATYLTSRPAWRQRPRREPPAP